MVGSTYDVVILSSSPPAVSPQRDAPSRRVAMPASSPLAFSPPASPLRTATGASTTNPRAAPIPEGAVRGFATVSSLVRSQHFTSRLDDDFAEIQQAHARGNADKATEPVETVEKPRRRPTKKAATAPDECEKPKPKPRARKQKPKSDKEIPDSDHELRRPQRFTKSPFFDERPTESTAKATDEIADEPKLTKAGKPRKPRVKKQKGEEEGVETIAKPKRVRVTKLKTAAVKGGKKQSNDVPVVSAHFQTGLEKNEGSTTVSGQKSKEIQDNLGGQPASIWDVPESPQPKKATARKQRPPSPVTEGLELDEAVLRRRDWTPPRDTAIASPNADSTGKENRLLAREEGAFNNLLSNFAYSESHPAQVAATEASATGEALATTKRRRVELVEIPGNQAYSRDSSPEKGKAPKKKARTITDLVTGQYGPRDEEPGLNIVKDTFFEPRTSTNTVPLNDTALSNTNASPKKQPRKRSSPNAPAEKAEPKAKARSKKASAKSAAKPKLVAEKLLSPSAAMLRLDQQDVLFGTSSQLALEESPTTIRQIQFAIKESEQDAGNTDYCSLVTPAPWSRLAKVQGKRGLWAASARDDEGGVLEHAQDVYIPELDRTQDIPLLMNGIRDNPVDVQNELPGPSTFIDIDDIPPDQPPPITIFSDMPTPPHTTLQASQLPNSSKIDNHTKDMEFKDIDTFEQDQPPSNQDADAKHIFIDIDEFDCPPSAQIQHSSATELRPPASTPTTRDLSPKKRGRPPKSQSTTSKASTPSIPMLRPSSKSRTNPKDKSILPSTPPIGSGRFIDIEEILDSEDDILEAFSPTPPRVQKLADLGPLPLVSPSPPRSPSKTNASTRTKPKDNALPDATLTPVHCIPTQLLEWAHIKPTVFTKITAHIRSLPPTTNPANPTWHEKILMYDPLVLEDLTAYLNARTDIRVFKRATQKQVKAWNKQRKADGEPALAVEKSEHGKSDAGDVLAVKRELEAYMVQAWCESLSICCVWGEARGRAGVRKGFY